MYLEFFVKRIKSSSGTVSAENPDLDPHFPGKRKRLGFSGNPLGRHLRLGIFLVAFT